MSESSASGGVASIQTSTVGDYRLGLISILAAVVGLLAGLEILEVLLHGLHELLIHCAEGCSGLRLHIE